jgi:predicted RNA binding protein YcfA (HicA-like mRNA interferase family)
LPKITVIHYQKLFRVFQKLGFVLQREKGDHLVLIKKGISRPVIIPKYSEIPVFIIKNNLRTAKVGREDYLAILKKI